ncbi:MAG: 5-formyltetrahydrofolate cyclo-ligase [Spirochaetaceae bacterium]|jgi:5-formyltetrahydrofolate cyclo-ligase|nr:5-formyltetrahydrofolate cyclo-ligase [Spirochaetaceae bacterium]
MTKAALRRVIKERLAALPDGRFSAEGRAAAERLAATELWRRHTRVLLYRSLPGEIDTWPLVERAFAAGKEVYFPKTYGKGVMRFFRVDSPEGPWVTGNFGIAEPAGGVPFRPPANADTASADTASALVITPGRAFDREGSRMGWGGGYYDRFFAALADTAFADTAIDAADADARPGYEAAGFCLDCQIVEYVPAESFDRRMDALCAASEFLNFAPGGGLTARSR